MARTEKNEKKVPLSKVLYEQKYKIAVSGAAETSHCLPGAKERAEEIGRLIARRGMILITGATTGLPYWAAKGAKEEGGVVIGFSPAASRIAHINVYHLPVDYHDVIVYTGFDYSGRNLILIRAADGIVTVCGRMGTLNEFTIAFEDKKPQAVFTPSGGTTDMIQEIIKVAKRGHGQVVFESDPNRLLDRLVEVIKKEQGGKGSSG
ncbi:MAG: hypothetical protein G01um101420_26 [Parcubacteria group bacterium Gr01-1014_20]|nr:MAG: hypothetical protein G01um101420_26 [Parcubacteria group bacterium Gr01-1014_20]